MNSIRMPCVLSLCLLMTMVATLDATFTVKRHCLVSLRLKSTAVTIMKDVPDFFVSAFLGQCPALIQKCNSQVKSHVEKIYGTSSDPLTGTTAQKYCTLFGTKVTPAEKSKVQIKYITDKCNTEQFMDLGQLCCYECTVAGAKVYLPVTNCVDLGAGNYPAGCSL